jgi:cytochrome c-type biogenesis protein CcmH/NrfF
MIPIQKRTLARAIALLFAAAIAVFATLRAPSVALGQTHEMAGSGVLDIRNDEERAVFRHLQCTCGCPRESIVTCQCGVADKFRSEVRGMMAKGMTVEEIKAEWARRYGPQALMVPPNEGANRLLYLVPLAAIVGMAAFAVTLLRRLRRRADEKAAAAPAPVAGQKRDEYDDKLDEELKQLDDE